MQSKARSQKDITDSITKNYVSLDWLCKIFLHKWPLIIGFIFLGGLCGVMLSILFPKQWKATALFEVGQVANKPLEATSVTVDRLRDPAFSYTLLEQLNQNEAKDLKRSIMQSINSLWVRKLPGSELIEVTINGPSPKLAYKIATLFFSHLESVHLKKYNILVDSLYARSKFLEKNISKIKTEQAIYINLKKTLISSNEEENLSEKLLLMLISTENDTQLRELNKELLDLQNNLLPVLTFNTKLVSGIYVTDKPTSPRVPIFAAVGALITLFFGLVWLSLSRSINKPIKE